MSKVYKVKRVSLSKLFLGLTAVASVFAVLKLIIVLIAAMSNGDKEAVVFSILMCFVTPFAVGITGVVVGLAYNLVSPKIGQFELELEEVE